MNKRILLLSMLLASSASTYTHTGRAPAVHMELKNSSTDRIVCKVYDTAADSAPVADDCPEGVWTEQLFDASWRQIRGNKLVTVGPASNDHLRSLPNSFFLGEFSASYYSGETLVHKENISRPAINYALNEFHSISASSFRAVWVGTLTVTGNSTQWVNVDFSCSKCSKQLMIDGVLQQQKGESSLIDFAPGLHDIRVEYANKNPHTVFFNSSFQRVQSQSLAKASAEIQELITANTFIAHVHTYQPSTPYADVTITIGLPQGSFMFLLVTSYRPAHWIIENPHNVHLKGVAYTSSRPGTMITVLRSPDVPAIFAINDFQFYPMAANVSALMGRSADATYSEYACGDLTIAQ